MLLILAIALVGAATYFFAELATSPARERRNLVHRAARYGRVRSVADRDLPRFRERVLGPTVARLARLALRLSPKMTMETVSAKLMAAGMRRTSPTGFLATKAVAGLFGGVLGLVIGASASPGRAFLWALGLGFVGYRAPTFVVSMRASKRQASVSAELPDALDLLAVSVEAGLGFDGAISKLTEHMEGPLIQEFELALGEMRIGEGRSEALKRMADRVPTAEMSGFVRAIVQADQLGISLGRILRVQAADTRLRRQGVAEEKAMKAPIKMLFPMVMFIFPAMFIVILGPALLNISSVLGT